MRLSTAENRRNLDLAKETHAMRLYPLGRRYGPGKR